MLDKREHNEHNTETKEETKQPQLMTEEDELRYLADLLVEAYLFLENNEQIQQKPNTK